MLIITRRGFFKTAGAGAAMAALASRVAVLKANPLGLPIGSQTYPHRIRIRCGDFVGLLKDMKGIGIDQVELCDPFNYADFKPIADGKAAKKMLDDNGIKAVSCHVGIGIYRTRMSEVLTWAHDIGLTQLSTADLGGTTRDGKSRLNNGITTEAWIKEAADEYNAIAKQTKAAGFMQVLHNEGFCNSRLADGRMTYPILIEYLDPALVGMQFQMSSMPSVGNPIMYFTIYPGRFWSAHLQGVNTANGMRAMAAPSLPTKAAPGEAGGRGGRGGARGGAQADPCAAPAAGGARQGGNMPAQAAGGQAPAGGGRGGGQALALGEDTADWPAIFNAAKTGGMKNFFIEQGWDQTVKSAAYLKTLS
jgi:sugar phosphate isomerase/epimerase